MKTLITLAIVVPAALFLAGCESDPTYATGPVVSPIATPPITSKPSGTLYSKTKSSTWTSPSGNSSVTKTRSTSASVSIDPNAALQTLAALGAGAAMPQPVVPGGPAAYFGKWQMTDGDNFRSCSIDLKADQSFDAYRAWTSGCFTPELFRIAKWQVRGYEMVLLDMSGKPRASLHPTAPNRYDGYIVASGQPISMWR